MQHFKIQEYHPLDLMDKLSEILREKMYSLIGKPIRPTDVQKMEIYNMFRYEIEKALVGTIFESEISNIRFSIDFDNPTPPATTVAPANNVNAVPTPIDHSLLG